jgi:hypothetical protein
MAPMIILIFFTRLPAMMRKFHEAKENKMLRNSLGSGTPMRSFVDDMAQAVVCIRKQTTGLFIQCRNRRRFDHQTIGQNYQKITGHQGENGCYKTRWYASKINGHI